VNGFSTTTCLPASIASSATGSWVAGGEQTSTTSTCGSIAARLGYGVAPLSRAKASRRSAVGDTTAARRASTP